MQKKEQESQLATNLEKQQGGQQFRLIDAASLPILPSSPKRLKISLFGLAGGIVLGLALALFREMSDTSFHSEKDVKSLDAAVCGGRSAAARHAPKSAAAGGAPWEGGSRSSHWCSSCS